MTKSSILTTFALLGAVAMGGTLAAGAANEAWAQAATAAVPSQNMTTHISARDHSGKNVFTEGGYEIGTIKNMVQYPSAPQVYAVVALEGPVMSSVSREVLIPAAQISFASDRAVLTIQASKELVRSMPVYKVDTTRLVTE